ncbi:MAG: hypothetical protein CMQ40_04125 [Gammaproteobacteria bacterium]|nr:hypothetical protein [Gammaproteobacteria bacterium]
MPQKEPTQNSDLASPEIFVDKKKIEDYLRHNFNLTKKEAEVIRSSLYPLLTEKKKKEIEKLIPSLDYGWDRH